STASALPEERTSVNLSQQYNVVSTQSTAKPGCVLKVGEVVWALQENSRLLMLNVFPEHLLTGGSDLTFVEPSSHIQSLSDRQDKHLSEDRHFVVAVEREGDCEFFLMFLLVISSHKQQDRSTGKLFCYSHI
ncbi:hypothetical protein COOONC_27579, partial [Cooperia oncophora]